MQEDEPLLVQRAQSDPQAFAALYQAYVDRVYNYIYQRTGSHPDAEDLTARTFLKAYTHLGSFVYRGVPFSAWLYRIAHNAVANWHRDRNRHQVVALDALLVCDKDEERPENLTQVREQQRAMLDAIRRLPAERQRLLILKFSEGLTNAEIAIVMGRTEGAVKSLYHRTLLVLREELQKGKVG